MAWSKRRQSSGRIIDFVEVETPENMQRSESVRHSYIRTELRDDITWRIVSERAWIKLPNMSRAVPINLPYVRVKLSKDHFSHFHAAVFRTATSGSRSYVRFYRHFGWTYFLCLRGWGNIVSVNLDHIISVTKIKVAVSSATSVSAYTNTDFKTQKTKIWIVRPFICLYLHKLTWFCPGKLL